MIYTLIWKAFLSILLSASNMSLKYVMFQNPVNWLWNVIESWDIIMFVKGQYLTPTIDFQVEIFMGPLESENLSGFGSKTLTSAMDTGWVWY